MPPTIPEEALRLYHIFGDETCQVRHKWMVLGTFVVSDELVAHVRRKFLAMKRKLGLREEIKWNRTNQKLLPQYKRIVDAALALISKHRVMQFHCVLICMDLVDDKKHRSGVPELGYQKFFHHLLMRYIRTYPKASKFHVHFDEHTTSVPLKSFKDAANRAALRDFEIDHWPIRKLEFVNSKDDVIFEINDLLLGAIGFLRKGKHKWISIGDNPKKELALYIRKQCPVRSFYQNTAPENKEFTLWAISFGGKRGKDKFRNRGRTEAERKLRRKRLPEARFVVRRTKATPSGSPKP